MQNNPCQYMDSLKPLLLAKGFAVFDHHCELFARYADILAEWNTRINLFSRKDASSVRRIHIPLSLSFLLAAPLHRCSRILDLGTGGGLPGIPLSIMCPNVNFVLVDSIAKKIAAVQDVISSLALNNVEAVVGRAEDIGLRAGFRHTFDAVIARSVADLELLVRWGKPFLRPTVKRSAKSIKPAPAFPSIIALKGGDLDAEIARTHKHFHGTTISVQVIDQDNQLGAGFIDKKFVIVHMG